MFHWGTGSDCCRPSMNMGLFRSRIVLGAIRETQPVAALASLILQGFVEVELDEEIIGPETLVRRIRA